MKESYESIKHERDVLRKIREVLELEVKSLKVYKDAWAGRCEPRPATMEELNNLMEIVNKEDK